MHWHGIAVCSGLYTFSVLRCYLAIPMTGIFRQRASTVNEISDHIESLRNFTPYDFARKPRSLLEWQRWKATEFRLFLLYTGPAALLAKLPDVVYVTVCCGFHIA